MKLRNLCKNLGAFMMAVCLMMLCACSAPQEKTPFQIVDITMDQLETMIANKDTFVLLVERENCPYCAALHEYLEETKEDHDDLVLYQLDTTDYHLVRENKGDSTLISDTENGKAFLKIFPYFLYTPSLYQIKEGVPVQAGIGYDGSQGSVSLWDVGSTIDWAAAKPVNVWGLIKEGQGTVSDSKQSEETAQKQDKGE